MKTTASRVGLGIVLVATLGVALQLQQMQNQLQVVEAIGGAAKMQAQYTADFNNAIQQGKTAEEATALAAERLALAQAQATSGGREQLAALQDQYAVASARTAQEAISAQAMVTRNNLLRQGADIETASAVASQQATNSRKQLWEANQKTVRSSEDQLELLKAQGTEQEGAVKSAIAYQQAIERGATFTQAAAISANTLAASLLQAAQNQKQLDDAAASYNAQQVAAHKGSGTGDFVPITMTPGTHTFQTTGAAGTVGYTFAGTPITPPGYVEALLASQNPQVSADKFIQDALAQNNTNALGGGGIDGAIAAIQKVASLGTSVSGPQITDATSALQTLYGAKNANAADNASKIANDQQFLGWLQSQPQTIANLQAISSLTAEIQSLATATSANTGATNTNSDLLSPYYAQDPRTSHIGFRSQGMADGGYVDVPGSPSANDNMIATIPVASGERIYVDAMPSKRGGAGGGTTISISMPITIQGGANKDEVGRTMYQAGQNMARQLAAAGR